MTLHNENVQLHSMYRVTLTSIPVFASTTPVTPPRVNKKIIAIAKSIGVLNSIDPPHIVAIQLNILIPVGTAITMVAAKKYALVSTSKPVVYIW